MNEKSVDFVHLFVHSENCYKSRQGLDQHVMARKVIYFASTTNYAISIADRQFAINVNYQVAAHKTLSAHLP
jgi:hypothetical protein